MSFETDDRLNLATGLCTALPRIVTLKDYIAPAFGPDSHEASSTGAGSQMSLVSPIGLRLG